jgi:alkylhydroperoxidase family enzyme
MTRHVAVADATFEAALAALGPRAVVELVGVIATYNMVSRFLVALGVEPE